MKISVLGSGGWGTALAMVLLENGHEVTLWSYSEGESQVLRETGGEPHAGGVALPREMHLHNDMSCVKGCEVVVLATPSFCRPGDRPASSPPAGPRHGAGLGLKGIEKDTSLTLTEVISLRWGAGFPIVALSGPSHAEEVGRRVPTTVVSASRDQHAAELVQDPFMNERFRVYASDDVVGVELAAALKRHRTVRRRLRRHGLRRQHQGGPDDPGASPRSPAWARPWADGRRPSRACRRGRSDRHLHLHALAQPPLRHPDRQGRRRGRGREEIGAVVGGLLCRSHGQGAG